MTFMKVIGYLLGTIGVVLGIYALTMDVSVEVNYSGGSSYGFPDRVNNIGLMMQRQNFLYTSGFLFICGLILVLYDKSPKVKHRYKEYLESAKKAEFKGQLSVAIDHYADAIYHLENDYATKSVSNADEVRRQNLLLSLKQKLDTLKKHPSS